MLRGIARGTFDVVGFFSIYYLIENGLLEKENKKVRLLQEGIARQAEILAKENTLMNQQVESRIHDILTIRVMKDPKKKINKRDWAECIEKLFNNDLSTDELVTINEKERFQEDPSTRLLNKIVIPKLETFSLSEVKRLLTFESSSPANVTASSNSPNNHPTIVVCNILAESSKKHEELHQKFMKNMEYVDEQFELVYAERLKPQEANEEEQKKMVAKVVGSAAFFYASSSLWNGKQERAPIFRSLLGKPGFRSSFALRVMLYRLLIPVVVVFWLSVPSLLISINEKLKDRSLTKRLMDWVMNDDDDDNETEEQQTNPLSGGSLLNPAKPLSEEQEVKTERDTQMRKLLLEPVRRPILWFGTHSNDNFTFERFLINSFYRPLSECIVFYAFFLKHLLSYAHPVSAHCLTAFMYLLTREDEEDGMPDLSHVLSNFSFVEGSIAHILHSIAEQALFHVTKGSVFLPFLVEVAYRFYYLLQDLLVNLPVFPVETSPFSNLSILFGVSHLSFSSMLLESRPNSSLAFAHRIHGLYGLFTDSNQPTLHPKVMEQLPNAPLLVRQLSKDLMHIYSSDYFQEKELQTLSMEDLCNCIIRLERYKKNCLPTNSYVPFWFIDEKVLQDLLMKCSPQQLQAMGSKSISDTPAPPLTNRHSFLRHFQTAHSHLPGVFSLVPVNETNLQESSSNSTSSSSLDTCLINLPAFQDNYMNSVYTLLPVFYRQLLQIRYQNHKSITLSQFENFLISYFSSIEPTVLIGELKKIEKVLNEEQSLKPSSSSINNSTIKPTSHKQNNKSTEENSDLLSYLHYYEDLAYDGDLKKEQLLDLMQEIYSSWLKADQRTFDSIEPLLFYEMKSRLMGLSIGRIQELPPHITILSKEFRSLPRFAQAVIASKHLFVMNLSLYMTIMRNRSVAAVLYKHGLTTNYYNYLIQKYSAHYPEINQLQKEWHQFFLPTPINTVPSNSSEQTANDLIYANTNNYPEGLRKRLWKDDDRRIIFNSHTLAQLGLLSDKKNS